MLCECVCVFQYVCIYNIPPSLDKINLCTQNKKFFSSPSKMMLSPNRFLHSKFNKIL